MKTRTPLIFFSLLLFIACKKDRVCNCTVTTDGVSVSRTQTLGVPPIFEATDTTITQPIYTVNTLKRSYDKVSKRDMRRSCYEKSEETINHSSTNVVPGIYTVTTTEQGKKTTSCKID